MTQQTLIEKIGKTVLECLEFDESVDSWDGTDLENGIDPDWIYKIQKQKTTAILQQVIEWVDTEVIGVLEDPKNDEIGSLLKIKEKLQQLKEEL